MVGEDIMSSRQIDESISIVNLSPPNRGVDFYFEFLPAKSGVDFYFEFLPANSRRRMHACSIQAIYSHPFRSGSGGTHG